MASEGLPVQLAARVLHTSESGYYPMEEAHGIGPLAAPPVPHRNHRRGSHRLPWRVRARRVHAELTLGRGIAVDRQRRRTRLELTNAIFEYLEIFTTASADTRPWACSPRSSTNYAARTSRP